MFHRLFFRSTNYALKFSQILTTSTRISFFKNTIFQLSPSPSPSSSSSSSSSSYVVRNFSSNTSIDHEDINDKDDDDQMVDHYDDEVQNDVVDARPVEEEEEEFTNEKEDFKKELRELKSLPRVVVNEDGEVSTKIPIKKPTIKKSGKNAEDNQDNIIVLDEVIEPEVRYVTPTLKEVKGKDVRKTRKKEFHDYDDDPHHRDSIDDDDLDSRPQKIYDDDDADAGDDDSDDGDDRAFITRTKQGIEDSKGRKENEPVHKKIISHSNDPPEGLNISTKRKKELKDDNLDDNDLDNLPPIRTRTRAPLDDDKDKDDTDFKYDASIYHDRNSDVPKNEKIPYNTLRVNWFETSLKDSKKKLHSEIISKKKALELAKSKNLDLVLVNRELDPPVCQIILWEEYTHILREKEKQKRKQSKSSVAKEIHLKVGIDLHDFQHKMKRIQDYLEEGRSINILVQIRFKRSNHRGPQKYLSIHQNMLRDINLITEHIEATFLDFPYPVTIRKVDRYVNEFVVKVDPNQPNKRIPNYAKLLKTGQLEGAWVKVHDQREFTINLTQRGKQLLEQANDRKRMEKTDGRKNLHEVSGKKLQEEREEEGNEEESDNNHEENSSFGNKKNRKQQQNNKRPKDRKKIDELDGMTFAQSAVGEFDEYEGSGIGDGLIDYDNDDQDEDTKKPQRKRKE